MEDEVVEQIRTRLAAATSAATALAKSLDALDENTLQTLEFWLAKQEGDSKCGKCHAQMPRGKQTSVCIACGNKRPPLPNTPAHDFKVSFAFLQFLETIHPPLKSGGRRMWNPTVSIASGNPEPSASIADVPVESEAAVTRIADVPVENEVAETSIEDMLIEREVAVALEPVRHSKEDHMVDEDMYLSNSLENPSDEINGTIAGEDGGDADELGEFQESLVENAVEPSHEIAEDMAKSNGYSHSDQFRTDLEASKVVKETEVGYVGASSSGAVNTWNTNRDHAPSDSVSAITQSEDNIPSDAMLENSIHIALAAPQVPEYDLSIFESFGGFESKQGSVLPKTDIDVSVWDFQDKGIVNTRLANVRAMERFTSDTSAFTTITDADSDSEDSFQEALSPPKLPHDLFMGLGANSRHNDLLGSLVSHDLVCDPDSFYHLQSFLTLYDVERRSQDDFQKVSASSHPLATLPTFQDPFSWPLDTLDAVSSEVVRGDGQNVEISSEATLEISGRAAVDPFPWPLEEFDNGPSTVAHTTIQQESLDLLGPSPRRSEGNIADPFSWPLDTSNQIMPDVDLGGEIGPVSALVNGTGEYDSDDWGEEDFVGSQAEPAHEAQFKSDLDLRPSSSVSTSFSSNIIPRINDLDKDSFFNDQSSPMPSAANNSAALPDGFANIGNGLESLVNTEEQKIVVEEDVFRSIQVKSFSFGDYNKKVDNIDDLFKRSLSIGNLKVKDMTEGDELLKALQAPSVPPSSSQPAEDILNFLNLKPASIPGDNETSTIPSHVRSVSFDTVELVPDEQSDEMFQFFHTRSQSAGSSATKSSAVKDGDISSSGNDIFDNTLETQGPIVNDDPFSFIHTTVSPSVTVEVNPATNGHDDDDDFFEWKSAEMPAPFVEAVLPPSVPTPGSSETDLFQWGTPTTSSPSKPLANGSQSGLLSLAGGLLPSQIRSSSKEDDLFAALSRNSPNTGGVRTGQATKSVESRLQPAATEALVDDSEDEFSDFVSTGALSFSSPPTAAQQPAGQTSQPAFDVSFFEAAQPDPSEKRNQDFFGDLMGLNFTNA